MTITEAFEEATTGNWLTAIRKRNEGEAAIYIYMTWQQYCGSLALHYAQLLEPARIRKRLGGWPR